MSELPKHLGGHGNKTWVDKGSLLYMKETYDVKTMVDVGCGVGDQVELAKSLGIHAIGVDGDNTINRKSPCVIHDFTLGECKKPHSKYSYFDLGWSVEFLEHVEEKYISNYMDLFKRCKYIICTHALPDTPGIHHVNCQAKDYWINEFEKYGMRYEEEITNEVKLASTMKKKRGKISFMGKTGLVFKNYGL